MKMIYKIAITMLVMIILLTVAGCSKLDDTHLFFHCFTDCEKPEEKNEEEKEIEDMKFPILKGDYFDQIAPSNEAEIFARGIISLPDRLESKIQFSPDGNKAYLQIFTPDYSSTILYIERVNEIWSEPVEASFAVGKNVLLSSISPDGKWVYVSTNVRDSNELLRVEITSDGWGELERVPLPINSDFSDHSLQFIEDGTGYLSSSREGSNGKDLWKVTTISEDTYVVENMGEVVNSTSWDFSPCVAADGSYMIFGSARFGRSGLAHLYITFYDEDTGWTAPIDLNSSGAIINDDLANQSNPSLSPDGKYLFFMRHYSITKMDLYWISTSFIENIRENLPT